MRKYLIPTALITAIVLTGCSSATSIKGSFLSDPSSRRVVDSSSSRTISETDEIQSNSRIKINPSIEAEKDITLYKTSVKLYPEEKCNYKNGGEFFLKNNTKKLVTIRTMGFNITGEGFYKNTVYFDKFFLNPANMEGTVLTKTVEAPGKIFFGNSDGKSSSLLTIAPYSTVDVQLMPFAKKYDNWQIENPSDGDFQIALENIGYEKDGITSNIQITANNTFPFVICDI